MGNSPGAESQEAVSLPIVLEAIIDAKVLSKMVNLTLRAPGKITGTIHSADLLLTSVSVTFDTMALLKYMMYQARIIVKKGIREAAYISGRFRKLEPLDLNMRLPNFQPPQNYNKENKISSKPSASRYIIYIYSCILQHCLLCFS